MPLSARESDSNAAVVFMYHRFGESRYPSTNIKLEQFEAHLEYLKQNSYNVWPLSKVVRYISEGKYIPQKTVALSIDDAYKSVYTQAFPRLKAKGFPFTVFVNTASIDSGSKNYMSWNNMREMISYGAEFANHSTSHDYLMPIYGESKKEWQHRLREEIETAQKRLHLELGENINENPRLFSYPFGEYTLQTADFIQTLGYIGITQTSGVIDTKSDNKILPRYPMAESFANIEDFVLKLNTLALPVKNVSPKEPLVTDENPPMLTIELEEELKDMRCYLSNGKPLILESISDKVVHVSSKEKLEGPREKYTCTAKAKSDRWYWYSHLWIIK